MKLPAFRLLALDSDLPRPSYAHKGDAGLDLRSRIDAIVPAGGHVLVPTGLAAAIPVGYAGFIHPRSGLAAKHGITVLNAPGTIDAGYRGEIGVILRNTSNEAFQVHRADRIAQLVFQQVVTPDLEWVTSLDDTTRGEGGFGSSGGFARSR